MYLRATLVTMKRLDRSRHGADLPHARFRYCHQEIVQVPDVGWLDPKFGDDYDLCPASPYADHEPSDARGDPLLGGPVL